MAYIVITDRIQILSTLKNSWWFFYATVLFVCPVIIIFVRVNYCLFCLYVP